MALFCTEQLFELFGRHDKPDNMAAVIVGFVVMTVAIIGWNWLAYYLWDIVRSAYFQLKNETENGAALPPGPYELRYQISQATLLPAQPTTTTYQVKV